MNNANFDVRMHSRMNRSGQGAKAEACREHQHRVLLTCTRVATPRCRSLLMRSKTRFAIASNMQSLRSVARCSMHQIGLCSLGVSFVWSPAA